MIEIRKADVSDTDALLEMYNAIIDDTDGKSESPRWTKGVYPDRDYIAGAASRGEMYAAFENGIPVGALVRNHVMAPGYERVEWDSDSSPEKVYVIHTLGVSPACQHRGIASMLSKRLIEDARKEGIGSIRLDVIDGNIPSIRLYEKLGFRNHGRMVLDYGSVDDGVAFTLMELVLGVH